MQWESQFAQENQTLLNFNLNRKFESGKEKRGSRKNIISLGKKHADGGRLLRWVRLNGNRVQTGGRRQARSSTPQAILLFQKIWVNNSRLLLKSSLTCDRKGCKITFSFCRDWPIIMKYAFLIDAAKHCTKKKGKNNKI